MHFSTERKKAPDNRSGCREHKKKETSLVLVDKRSFFRGTSVNNGLDLN